MSTKQASEVSYTISALGKRGTIRGVVLSGTQRYFRCEQIEATDSIGGRGTKIRRIFISGRGQIGEVSVPSSEFDLKKMRRLHRPDVHQGWCDIQQPRYDFTIAVEFIEDCEFRAKLLGRAIEAS